MQNITIWHNAKCSKSRATLELLEEKDLNINIVKYLESTPSELEIRNVLQMLGIEAKKLMRTKEDIYISLNLKDVNNEDELIKAMVENPSLIERPIVIKNGKAAIGRPIENVVELIS